MLNIIHEQVEKLCFPEFICWKNFRLWPKICYITSRIILSSMNLKKKKKKHLLYYLAKAEAPVLWPPHEKSWLIGKDSDTGRDLGQEKKGTTEDEMAGWHHGLDGRESEWTPRDGDEQGGLACCDSWGLKESDTTEQLNWTELKMG